MSEKNSQVVAFRVSVAGDVIDQTSGNGLISLSIEDHIDMIGVANLTFDSFGKAWSSFELGAKIDIEVGGSSRKMFAGYITGLRHSWRNGHEKLTLVAMDPLVKLATSRNTMVFEDVMDSDAVSAAICMSDVEEGVVDETGSEQKYIFQRNESNYNFCKRMAARNGFFLTANEGKIDFVSAQFSGAVVSVSHRKLVALDYTMEPYNVPSVVTVIGWDYVKKQKVEGSAGSGDLNLIGGGANVVGQNGNFWVEPSYISDVFVNSQTAAKKMAESELNRLARRFVRGRATVKGNAGIYAGVRVSFKGLFTKFNPDVFVVSARHVIDADRGYLTEFSFCGNTYPQ